MARSVAVARGSLPGLEVLHDGSEVELVTCAGETPQAHSLETVVGL
jgi:hypothetical protein